MPETDEPQCVTAHVMVVWRNDYRHDEMNRDGSPKYPGGVCGRPDCRPCRWGEIERGRTQTWNGAARMAAVRRDCGIPLSELDEEALRRVPDPSFLSV